jgi:hypothetical protein
MTLTLNMIPPPQKLKFYLIDSNLRVINIETNESIVNTYNPISILAILRVLKGTFGNSGSSGRDLRLKRKKALNSPMTL